MPYQSLDELPQQVKSHLPRHAQKIYKEAFNHAWAEYERPEDRRGESTREETAHKVAWSAVKQKYAKTKEGYWKPK